MKTNFSRDANGGLTVIEMLVVIACVIIVLAMILPPGRRPQRAPLVTCVSHVRQIDLGFLMYASDNDGKFPIQISVTNGGTMDFLDRGQTFPYYQKLSKYIAALPVLVCPADKTRRAATNYESLTDTNLSYFLNADVSTNNPSSSILDGERTFEANGDPVRHGTFLVKTNTDLAWTSENHHNEGTLGFTDGHAEVSRGVNLNALFQRQGLATNRLSVP
jgi:hypothetical protein